MIRWLWLLVALLVLNGCTTAPVSHPTDNRLAYQERVTRLGAVSDWSLAGKISLDDGEQGGSGKFQWAVRRERTELDFHGAMGRGAWRLQAGPGGATLQEANGAEHSAAGISDLLQQRMGWPIPVDALQWWVRGLAAPGNVDAEHLDPDGLLTGLVQFGWTVSFRRYASDTGPALPVRLEARRDNYRVKLAISRWRLGNGADSANQAE